MRVMPDFKLNEDDKRTNIRVDFNAPVQLSFPGSKVLLKGVLLNLSISGMLVELEAGGSYDVSDVKGSCIAEIQFAGEGSRLLIDELQSTVARMEDNRLALEFATPLEWFLLFCVYKDKQVEQ